MKILIRSFFALGLLCAASQAQLVVSHLSATGGNNINLIKPYLRVENQGTTTVDLSKSVLDYLIDEDGVAASALVAECWYSSVGACSEVTAEMAAIPLQQDGVRKANIRVRLGFRSGVLAPGQILTLQWGLHDQAWQHLFNETDDWSFTVGDGAWHIDARVAIFNPANAVVSPNMVWKGSTDQLPDPMGYKSGEVVRVATTGSSYILENGAWVILAEAGKVGPKGDVGPQGLQGVAGKDGAVGLQGAKGDVGATGPMGLQGLTGPVGATGATGAKGDMGAIGPIGPQGPAGVVDPSVIARVTTLEAHAVFSWIKDSRDGQMYKTVKIGAQNWMAENLNYAGPAGNLGACYNNDPTTCFKYGRLYSWVTLMDISTSFLTTAWGGSDVNHRGICPEDWHVPSRAEWSALSAEVAKKSGAAEVGTALKSKSGWNQSGNGTDLVGFNGLPASALMGGHYSALGNGSIWWSASENADYGAFEFWLGYLNHNAGQLDQMKPDGFAARCVQD